MEECCEYVEGVTDNRQGVVGSPTEIDQLANFPQKASDLDGLFRNCLNNGKRT